MAEETTKSARRAAKASMRVFEKAIGGAGKVSKRIEKEAPEVPLKVFEEALNKPEADAKEGEELKEAKKDVQSRLEFLARMYTANKDKGDEDEVTEREEMEQG